MERGDSGVLPKQRSLPVSDPENEPSAATPAQSLVDIAIECIVVDPHDGRRALNEAVVAGLVQSIASVGLLEPILVTPIGGSQQVALVAGLHRLEACKRLNHERIKATRLEGIAGMAREEIEIAENLIRAELSPAERASHYKRLKEIYETKHPETRKGAQGGGRAGKGTRRRTGSAKSSFSAATAGKTGRSKRSIEREVRRADQLGDELQRIRGTSLDSPAEIDALIALPADKRADLIARAQKGDKVSAASLVEARLTADRYLLNGQAPVESTPRIASDPQPPPAHVEPLPLAKMASALVDVFAVILQEKAAGMTEAQVKSIFDRVLARWRKRDSYKDRE